MKNRETLLLVTLTVLVSGCSNILNTRIFGHPQDAIRKDKNLTYNLLMPRRVLLDKKTSEKFNKTRDYAGRLKYYSANGHECRIISADISSSACLINNQWKISAPVLIVETP